LRKSDLLGLALVLLLVVLAFADILSTKRALYDRDVAWVAMPERAVLRDAVRDGFPFWNARFAAGQPLAANPAFAVFYPPHWLIFLPNFLFACAAEIVVHFLLAAAGMFLLLRSLRLRVEAAAFGAVSYAWSGVLLSLTNVPPYLFAMTWWPWLGFFADRFFEHRRRADFALAALALGMIVLVGEPATILESGALLGAFALCRLRARPALGWTAAICAAALFVGAATLIPAADFVRDTARGSAIDYDAITRWSLEPAAPLELLGIPVASSDRSGRPWVASGYCGMLVPALLIAGFVHRVRGWQFAAAIAAIGYALALGRHAPFLRLLYLAGLKAIRFPEKWFLPVAFVLIVFAAIAADRVLDDARVRRTAHIAAAALIFVNAIAGMTVSVAAAVALTLILFARGRLLVLLLAAFVLVDLGARTHTVAPRIDAGFYIDVPAIAHGVAPRSRIYHDGNWQAHAAQRPPSTDRMHHGMYPDMQALWGFDGVLEPDVAMLNLRPTADFLDLFIRSRFGARRDLVPMLLSFTGATHVIDASGRVVALANSKLTMATSLAAANRIAEPHAWPPGTAFVEQPFAPAPARIERVRESASAVDADVDAAGRALLVIAITPHKYWRATIDGAPAPLMRANVGFQAVEIPRGRHHVALRYRNPLIVICGIVSLIAAIVLGATAATALRR
jgi:Bacterial membrane protein YfhO